VIEREPVVRRHLVLDESCGHVRERSKCQPETGRRVASAGRDERSALLELMIPKVLSVEEPISLGSEGSLVLERLS
jgi:hypothetical protein